MFAFIKGRVASIEENALVIEMGGLGLRVLAPLSRLQVQSGQEVFLHTHMQIREDSWLLYGFAETEQLEVFKQLLAISGIGAKTALSVVNQLGVEQLAVAVQQEDVTAISAVPGIGKKTAQRLLLELKGKLAPVMLPAKTSPTLGGTASLPHNDLLAALQQLGFSALESRSLAVAALERAGEQADVSVLIKEALKIASNM